MFKFFTNIVNFFKEVKEELKKVSWSKKKGLVDAVAVVLSGTAFLALFIAVCDAALGRFLQLLIK